MSINWLIVKILVKLFPSHQHRIQKNCQNIVVILHSFTVHNENFKLLLLFLKKIHYFILKKHLKMYTEFYVLILVL